MIKCLIIDDDPVARKNLSILCSKVDYLQVIGEFDNPIKALTTLNNRKDIDLIFLDIHMPEINGMDFFKSTIDPPNVIFTTGDQSKAIEAFEVNALDYLVKPIQLPRFLKAIERVKPQTRITPAEVQVEQDADMYINVDGRLTRLAFDKIALIEAKGDYALIKMDQQAQHIVRSSMKKIEQKLPAKSFMRIHRSYIVNLHKIVDIEDNSILVNQEVIPVSRANKMKLVEALNLL
ncbi:MAG: LytTR family DNA-binding domain-containing protein [Saprospiraceae bacterium]|nr:LytTR family DNA-binding domain-containing protein [Saprospiraceae bacterium]